MDRHPQIKEKGVNGLLVKLDVNPIPHIKKVYFQMEE